jgi:hypothetical protein
MQNGTAWKQFEQALLHHHTTATQAFFGGLKNQIQSAVKLRILRNATRGSQ